MPGGSVSSQVALLGICSVGANCQRPEGVSPPSRAPRAILPSSPDYRSRLQVSDFIERRYLSPMKRPSIIAHRGASGYEYENSRAAFRRAVMLDADGVELDVHATRDGAMVVHHDAEIAGFGPIGQLLLSDIRHVRLRNGERLPLLEEILDLMGDREVWVEVKTLAEGNDHHLLAVLDRGPAPERYAVHSFDHRIVRRLGDERPELRRGILLSAYLEDPVAAMRAVGATTLWQEWQQVDRELVTRIHDAGCTIVAWTVNDIGDLERMTRLGVDGLCGNYPDRIRVAMATRVEEASST
jgi:glycerophosphoryl diester phosphodiesterase